MAVGPAKAEHASSDGRIVDGHEAPPDVALLGGKGARLAALGQAGLPVPPWICLTVVACAEILDSVRAEIDPIVAGLSWDDRGALRTASRRIADVLLARGLPEAVRRELLHRVERLGPGPVAVRSSVVGEDSARDSFAGQMDTFLHVGRDELVERVLACLASAFSERALLYRHLRGHDLSGVRAAVLVQRMIESRVSGVLFTANPTTGDRGEIVVSAGLGLGEGIVGGWVECDTWFLDARSGAIRERVIVEKRSRVAPEGPSGGTRLFQLSEPVTSPALDDDQLARLVDLGRRVEALEGAPQDVEWAFDDDGRLFLLQARPITTLERARETVFDNSNVVESYPGISLPLTFSVVRESYEVIFRAAARRLGVPEATLQEGAAILAHLVGLIDGRIYYNIGNWYRLYAMIPGTEPFLPAWEKALGLERRFVRRADERSPTAPPSARRRVVRRVLAELRSLDGEVRSFVELVGAELESFRRIDLGALDAHELLELWERLLRLREPFAVSVVNDFFTQQFYELLGRCIARWNLGDPATLRNELVCGEKGMESVEPVRSALRLTELVGADPALRSLFESDASDAEVWRRIATDPACAALHEAARRHFEQYGDRTLQELKLETPPLDETPEFLVAMIRNYLRGGKDVDTMERREREIRDRAEAQVVARLRGHPLRRLLFRFVLERSRRTIRHRENLRLARTRVNGMWKRVLRALARRLVAEGLLDTAEDAYYLTHQELEGVVRGASVTRDLRALVALRRREYAGFAATRPDPRIVTRGIVYRNRFEGGAATVPLAGGRTLTGIGCSPGRVVAPARVVLDPQEHLDIRGEILVVPMTDPGWVFLMVAAGGLVSEKGSILSHTAIIGRELGIPTVVGVPDATRRVPDGATVELDGTRGTLTIQEGEES